MEDLIREVFNPHARIYDAREGGGAITVDAPVRGQRLWHRDVFPDDAEAWRLLERILGNGHGAIDFTELEVREARRLGLVIAAEGVSRPVSFVKMHAESLTPTQVDISSQKMSVEAWSRWCSAGLDKVRTAWFEDPTRRISLPCIRIEPERDSRDWFDAMDRTRQAAAAHGYGMMRALLPAPFVKALASYCERLVAEGWMAYDDSSAERFFLHNDPFIAWLHVHLAPLLQRMIPEPVKPSYCYLVSYSEGAALPKHVDREQCEWTISLKLEEAPERGRGCEWPLQVWDSSSNRPSEIVLESGDAAVFAGRRVPHGRGTLGPGTSARFVFFHFVPEAFTGSLD